jgi:hypothetical protein
MPNGLADLPRAALAIVAALAIAFGAVACGSEDDSGGGGASGAAEQEPLNENDYLERVNDAQTDFAADAAKLDLANPSSPQGFKRSLDSLVGLIDTLIDRLEKVAPPEQVGTEHDDLTQTLSDYRAVLVEEKDGLSSEDRRKVVAAAKEIGTASRAFSRDFDAVIADVNENLQQ